MKRAIAAALSLLAAPLAAQSPNPSQQAWNALARPDIDAALALISDNHPGAAPELGDTEFHKRLAKARANAEQRLPLVRDYYGHAALMNGIANEFRDGHVWSNPLLSASRRSWAGIVMSRSGGQWVVGAQEKTESEPDLEGARLLSCDGVEADAFARARTGTFHAHPDIEADIASNAYTLLLDDRNPFAQRPTTCRFQLAEGRAVDHMLQWREVRTAGLQEAVSRSYRAAQAGLSLLPFAGGHWIELGNLSNEAARVVEAVRDQRAALRTSPMVVIDLRGNSGGNSQYALDIAGALVGETRAMAADRPASACSGAFWRVSADNLAALRRFVAGLPEERRLEWQAQADDMAVALPIGRTFSPALPACASEARPPAAPPARLPPSAMTGRLVLVTDRACFSSCLIAADLFRRLGALHVGKATDMSTRYMEVREIVLPSGLRTFSTLQKVALGLGDFGPYEPVITYPGALAETDKLKAWVAALPR